MPAEISDLRSPYRLAALTDGAGYRVASLKLSQPNLFTRIGSLGDLVVKVPSDRGTADFAKYVKREVYDSEDIRQNEEMERFQNLNQALRKFPSFLVTRSQFGDDFAHFLVVYRIQHARLEASSLVGVPETRFVVLQWAVWLFGTRSTPAIIQQRIRGVCLFDMVEPMDGVFLPQYSHLRTRLKRQLEPLVESKIAIHIDWNIQNFIWREADNRLYYVDSKPTTIAAKWTVEHNLASLRETFLS